MTNGTDSPGESSRVVRADGKTGRIHPCSQDDGGGGGLNDLIDATEDTAGHDPVDLTFKNKTQKYAAPDDESVDDGAPTAEMTTTEQVEAFCGLGYVVLTLVLTVYYLRLLSPVMSNDLWWSGFNSTGAQSYIIDVVNEKLVVAASQPIDLTTTAAGLPNDYSTFYSPIRITATYARTVVDSHSYDLPTMVTALQFLATPDNGIPTQFCWIDFNKTWEVAHTSQRQKRCYARYTTNAAVYWETTCRFVDWKTWMAAKESQFNTTLGNAMRRTPAGADWIRRTANAYKDVPSEVAVWKQAGLTHFKLQYTNSDFWGVEETIFIQNAFGGNQAISIKSIPSKNRGALWTTAILCWGPWNDLNLGASMGYSLVRDDPFNQRFTPPCSYDDYLANPSTYNCDPCKAPWNSVPGDCYPDFELWFGFPSVPGVNMVSANIGPFGSVDLYLVAAPPSLKALVSTFQALFTVLAQSSEPFHLALDDIPGYEADPVPSAWSSGPYLYMGGDPTCPLRQPVPFVQSSFAYDVSCTKQDRHTMLLNAFNSIFALLASSPAPSATTICSQCPTLSGPCWAVVTPATAALAIFNREYTLNEGLVSQIKAARDDVVKLGVGTMQLAINATDGSDVFLFQTLLSSQPSSWDFFGWIYLFEWATGSREVVSFEGDWRTLPLVSDKYDPIINEARALEVPKSACQYLWVVSVVVSIMLIWVGSLLTVYSIYLRGRIVGRNLFRFNRIVGAVWLGRPLLLVRGMTAVVLLSTSPLEFRAHNGYTQFEFAPRTFVQSMLVSGEAMWISYVINDFLLLLTRNSQPHFAPISTCLGWFLYLLYDVSSPYKVEAAIDRQCSVSIRSKQINCVSGSVAVGNYSRAVTYVIIQLACIAGAYIAVKVWQCIRPSKAKSYNGHLLLSGTATAFLHKETLGNGAWVVDRASCVMCGLITVGKFIFDLKLWLLVVDANIGKPVKWGMKIFTPPELTNDIAKRYGGGCAAKQVSDIATRKPPVKPPNRIMAVVGMFYVFATIFGSVTYLTLTSTNMANDFWWANYNASREHAYVARLYNLQLVLQPHGGQVALDDAQFVDMANFNISLPKAVSVWMPPLYVSQVKSTDGTDIAVAVRGLRNMDACLAPWISAQYCWLDFQKTWEMANSAKRQLRCNQNYTTNGAAYLEGVLRNVDSDQLLSCWGKSLDIAIKTPLSATDKGRQWWDAALSADVPEADEIAYWRSTGVASYTVNWQNYKAVGIIDTFNIQNAFGFEYPMTLKYTNGTMQLSGQTSMKMHWTFASDLWAVTSASNFMSGASLIRGSGNFAFATRTMEEVLVQNGTLLSSDLQRGSYATFKRTIGPFGSVDVKHVVPPRSLTAFVLNVRQTIATMGVQNPSFNRGYAGLSASLTVDFTPTIWRQKGYAYTMGGNLFCKEVSGMNIRAGMYLFSGAASACNSGMGEFLSPGINGRLVSVIGASLVETGVFVNTSTPICNQVKLTFDRCSSILLKQPLAFLKNTTYFPDAAIVTNWIAMAKTAQADLVQMNIEIAQYGIKTWGSPNMDLMRHNIFDPSFPDFHYVGWLLAFDWVTSYREVLAFQGDVDTINIITTPSWDVGSLVNPLEIPVNVAYYIRYACLYVTCIIICVAVLAIMYLLANRGYVEGLNLFELNRVAGIVWIGRTFLFIRSMAAISLLSTQVLALEPINGVWHFVSATAVLDESTTDQAIRLFKTFLAAGEVSWLVFVLNDVLMVITQQYTPAYVFKCNFMVWGLSALLSLAFPTTHTATFDRKCEFSHVDFQLVCSNGTISIGSFSRFLTLVGVCIGSIVVCYLFERVLHPKLPPASQNSLFLASSAKYVFDPARWIDHEVYYIDPASAVINGILSLRSNNAFYIFDLKIWRLFVIEESAEKRKRLEDDGELHLLSAIPLTD